MRIFLFLVLLTVCAWRFLSCYRDERWTFVVLWGIMGSWNLVLLTGEFIT